VTVTVTGTPTVVVLRSERVDEKCRTGKCMKDQKTKDVSAEPENIGPIMQGWKMEDRNAGPN